MQELANINSEKKYSSLYLVEQINIFRVQEGNRSELRHSDFLAKIEKRFPNEITERKTSLSEYKDSTGRFLKMYELDYDQSMKILMQESYIVQDAIMEVLKKQQAEIERLKTPQTYIEALKSLIAKEELIEQQQIQLTIQAPKVQAFYKVIDNSATFTVASLSDIVDIGSNKLFDILRGWNWVVKKDTHGTSSTRYCEEQRYGKTLFMPIMIGLKEINKKQFVLTKRGIERAIEKLNKQLAVA